MSRKCEISGLSRQVGHRVSHAKNRTKHVFQANLISKKIYSPELGKNISLRISTRILRTIDKLGLSATLKKYGMKLSDLKSK